MFRLALFSLVASADAGACSAEEQAALVDPATTGQKANDCGTKSYNVITGKFDHDKFNQCFTASAGISTACSECYAVSGEYGAANCKADCLLGWCKSGCLECTKPAQADLGTCTGFTTPTADPCEELSATVTGACSADEQAALADPATTGQKANDCGTKSYNVITGKFDHDKFNQCFTASAGISTACSECYAVSGEYGAANCKADCLLGWCKSGCLECTKPAQADLGTCTGFTTSTADPCEELSATITLDDVALLQLSRRNQAPGPQVHARVEDFLNLYTEAVPSSFWKLQKVCGEWRTVSHLVHLESESNSNPKAFATTRDALNQIDETIRRTCSAVVATQQADLTVTVEALQNAWQNEWENF